MRACSYFDCVFLYGGGGVYNNVPLNRFLSSADEKALILCILKKSELANNEVILETQANHPKCLHKDIQTCTLE